jgi:hypothetical protein
MIKLFPPATTLITRIKPKKALNLFYFNLSIPNQVHQFTLLNLLGFTWPGL